MRIDTTGSPGTLGAPVSFSFVRRASRSALLSCAVAYRNGVFEPLEKVEGAQPGAIYTAFSD